MEVKDIQANQGNIDLVLTVTEKGDVRTFEKFGKTGKVCTAKVQDETGSVKLTLWNDDTDKLKVGDKIHLKNGWCSEYNGEKQLSAGKFGEIEVLESGNAPEPAEEPEEKKEEAPVTVEDEEAVITEEETIE